MKLNFAVFGLLATSFTVALAPISATTVTTTPVGFVSTTITSGFNAVGITMVNEASFTGEVVAVDDSSDTVTLNSSVDLSQGGPYYLEATSGEGIEGERFDIISADGATLSLDVDSANTTLADISILEPGVDNISVVIREHFTIGDIAESVASDAQSSNNPDDADQILLFQDNSFIRHLRAADGNWYKFYGDFGSADDIVLPAGTGFFYFRSPTGSTSGSEFTLRILGAVRTNQYVALLPGGYQLISTGFPLNESPDSLGLSIATGFTGSNNPDESDTILEWDNGSFKRYILAADGKWYKFFGDFGEVTLDEIFAPNKSLFIRTDSGVALAVQPGF